ncbi:uncharacterized protein LOC142099985 [Mixophyes fleayi]|uniref:uncharacterized protein LOC142099985 n=1 Tax=Mixophyes fleayi TaxID=3061075 RepID=UPI003F4DD001
MAEDQQPTPNQPTYSNQQPTPNQQPTTNQQPTPNQQPSANQPPSQNQPPSSSQPPSPDQSPTANQPSSTNQQPSSNLQPTPNQPPSANQPSSSNQQPAPNQTPSLNQQQPIQNQKPVTNQPPNKDQVPGQNQPPGTSQQPGANQPSTVDQEPATDPQSYSNLPVIAFCSSDGTHLEPGLTEVSCPPGCIAGNGHVWGSDVYTDNSAICKAAIHAGKMTNEGGSLVVQKTPGLTKYESSKRNEITSHSQEEWPSSFTFKSPSVESQNTSPPAANQPPAGNSKPAAKSPPANITKVEALCSSSAMHLSTPAAEVKCPPGCEEETESEVWGSDIYTDDSSLCRAAIHSGALTNDGGTSFIEKRPGQDSYEASTKNGIESDDCEEWSGSFVFITPEEAAKYITTPPPSESPPKLPRAEAVCSSSAIHLPADITEVRCPSKCKEVKGEVYGTGVYTSDSSICRAAIHDGKLDDNGGSVIVEKKPGLKKYFASSTNGIKSSDHEEWTGSFSLITYNSEPPAINPPSTTNPSSSTSQPKTGTEASPVSRPPRVEATCSWTEKQLTATVTEVNCPEGCQQQEELQQGSSTEDSLICLAAIRAGKISNNGGSFILEKRPEQSTQNGMETNSKDGSTGLLIFRSLQEYDSTTNVVSTGVNPQTGNFISKQIHKFFSQITLDNCLFSCNGKVNEATW